MIGGLVDIVLRGYYICKFVDAVNCHFVTAGREFVFHDYNYTKVYGLHCLNDAFTG